jgi:hypothetical protein
MHYVICIESITRQYRLLKYEFYSLQNLTQFSKKKKQFHFFIINFSARLIYLIHYYK